MMVWENNREVALQQEYQSAHFQTVLDDPEKVRSAAKYRAKFQLDRLRNYLLPSIQEWLPRSRPGEVPEWLWELDPQGVIDRIFSMLSSLQSTMDNEFRSEESLHHPLRFGPDMKFVTTPMLMAITAALYSHTRWGVENLHDLESARRAEELLSQQPKWIRGCIISLVAWKNVFRTSVSKRDADKEILVISNGRVTTDHDEVCTALGQKLRTQWTPDDDDTTAQSNPEEWRHHLVTAFSLLSDSSPKRST